MPEGRNEQSPKMAREVSESDKAARELSLLLETRKNVQELLQRQIAGARMIADFYEKYHDKLEGNSTASKYLERRGLPQAGPLLLDVFMEKLGYPETNQDIRQALQEMSDSELAEIWKDFIESLRPIHEQALILADLEINEWLLRPQGFIYRDADAYFRRDNTQELERPYTQFFLLDQAKGTYKSDWATASQPPSRDEIAAMISDQKTLQQKEEEKKQTELRRDKKPTNLYFGYNAENERIRFERLFGEQEEGFGEFLKIIPESLQYHVREITFKPRLSARRMSVFGEERFGEAAGLYHPRSGRIEMKISGVSAENVFNVLFHEIGHAIDDRAETVNAVKMKVRFLEAVFEEGNRFSMYATSTYTHEGMARGFSEDFAETVSYFFSYPDLLKEKNSKRFAAMEDIIRDFYPKINIEETREKIRKFIKRDKEKIVTDPEILREALEAGKDSMWCVIGRYITQQVRPLDFAQLRGRPNTQRNRYIPGVNQTVHETFGPDGSLIEESISHAGGSTTTFYDATHDDTGRILSYKTNQLQDEYEIFLDYQGEKTLPKSATVVGHGIVLYSIDYQKSKDGRVINETVTTPVFNTAEVSSRYVLNEQDQISLVEGLVSDQSVFGKRYNYDEQGRLIEKSIVAHDGRTINEILYTYDQETERLKIAA